MLVLLSDGIFEYAAASGEQFGRHRLQDVLRKNAAARAAQLCEAILAAVREFAGGAPQEDDVTMVVLRRLPSSN